MQEISKEKLGYLLVIPALVIVAGMFIFPFAITIWYSLHSVRLNMPTAGTPWMGLMNYIFLFSFERFLYSLKLTLLFAGSTVAIQLILGLGIALTIYKNFRGRLVVRAIVISPWAICLVVAALIWKWIYNAAYGVLNYVLMRMDLLSEPCDWLGSGTLTIIAAMVAVIWRDSPFAAIILLTGLQSINPQLYEAGKLDGANRFQLFWSITLPLLKPAILVFLLFQSIHEIRAFDLMFALTQGGPGNTTELASLFTYKFMFSYLDFGKGSASAIVLAIFTMVLSLFYMKILVKKGTFE